MKGKYEMSKFKVGERYKVSGTISRNGNIIEITAVDENHYLYKTIEGNDAGCYTGFDENSMMGNGLIPILSDRYELHITCTDGKTTNAVYKVNGKIEKRAFAVCNTCDTFNFNTGAELAINRVLYGTDYNPKDVALKPIQPTPQPQPEDKPQFAVGDKVKVIKPRTSIKHDEIGKFLVINEINPNGKYTYSKENHYGAASSSFVWFEDELEPYTEPEQPKVEYLNMTVVYITNNQSYHTQGKTYKVIDGIIESNIGKYNPTSPVKTLDELNKMCIPQFIEFKGESPCTT